MADGEIAPGAQRRLEELVAYPREDLAIEIKPWLDLGEGEGAAALGQALLALANHGGGFVVLGFEEVDGAWVPVKDRPANLSSYNQDAINGIVARYAEPTFHCEVHHVEHPQSKDLFPVVDVPGGHRVPIRAKADSPERRHIKINTYYIRRPGPSSDAPRTGREWDELIGRCVRGSRDELVESIRAILEVPSAPGPFSSGEVAASDPLADWIEESRARFETLLDTDFQEQAPRTRYQHGVYTVAYSVEGDLEPPDLQSFRAMLGRVQGHETGWPPWYVFSGELAPRPFDGTIECWLFETTFADPGHSDFWRGSPRGFMYLVTGYDDDSNADRFPPGQRFDFLLPIWRIGPCLLHAARLAVALGDPEAQVHFRVVWEGLAGRVLSSWAQAGRYFPPDRRPAVQDRVEAGTSASANRISATLPELLLELTSPLYAVFDFFTINPETVRAEVAQFHSAGGSGAER